MRMHDILADPLSVRSRWVPRFTSGILFDFRTNPLYTPLSTHDGGTLDPFQPATVDHARYMRILIRLSNTVELSLDVNGGHSYVSIGHVLWALHQKLQEPVSQSTFTHLSKRQQRRVSETFFERMNKSSNPARIHDVGLQAIDLLCGDTKFHGLEPSSKGMNIWKLILRRPD